MPCRGPQNTTVPEQAARLRRTIGNIQFAALVVGMAWAGRRILIFIPKEAVVEDLAGTCINWHEASLRVGSRARGGSCCVSFDKA